MKAERFDARKATKCPKSIKEQQDEEGQEGSQRIEQSESFQQQYAQRGIMGLTEEAERTCCEKTRQLHINKEGKNMKKRFFTIALCAALTASMSFAAFSAETEVETEAEAAGAVTVADLPAEPEFDAPEDAICWTTIEYTIEDLGEDMVCTVAVMDDKNSEYDIQCNFFGDDQEWRGTYADGKVETISDKTGFMEGDAPKIIELAIEQKIWVDAAAAEAETEGEAAGGELPAEPEFDPVEGYDVFTTVEYTIEDLGEDMVCTVCKKADGSEYDIQCNFFGDDQEWSGTYADGAVETISDKTGFMEGDAPKIIDIAEEQNIWLPIE